MKLYKIKAKDYSTYKIFYVVAENPDLACQFIQTKYNEWYSRDITITDIHVLAEENRYSSLDLLIIH